VQSRFEEVDAFVESVENLGFARFRPKKQKRFACEANTHFFLQGFQRKGQLSSSAPGDSGSTKTTQATATTTSAQSASTSSSKEPSTRTSKTSKKAAPADEGRKAKRRKTATDTDSGKMG
ncbi:unnamed protein product, partial [Amoebophrya sp. A25]